MAGAGQTNPIGSAIPVPMNGFRFWLAVSSEIVPSFTMTALLSPTLAPAIPMVRTSTTTAVVSPSTLQHDASKHILSLPHRAG